jgi:hypothetical protein
MKHLVFFLSVAGVLAPARAQSLEWGVKGGMPLNDAIDAAGNFKSQFKRFTLGPTLEANLPLGLSVELDALYKRTGYSDSTEYTTGSWEFPLVAKYKLPGEHLRPYVAAGASFRHIGDIPHLLDNGSKGFILGAGLKMDLKLVKFSPEIRWTHWGNDVFRISVPQGTSLHSAANQAEFLIGLTF